ncbi:unnamed protein product [Sphenostylis stenocarpa]|uniref:Uncharacterized protein n=1 Tax=Sphenostylis stenocarpa TaxID=92480 RepID=A0AA86SQT4_9FABA|nr:unnamed protein product [Sphenostylis stenocarpa]
MNWEARANETFTSRWKLPRAAGRDADLKEKAGKGLEPLLKGNQICPWVLREALSAVDLFLIHDRTDGVVFSAVPKPDRKIWHGGCVDRAHVGDVDGGQTGISSVWEGSYAQRVATRKTRVDVKGNTVNNVKIMRAELCSLQILSWKPNGIRKARLTSKRHWKNPINGNIRILVTEKESFAYASIHDALNLWMNPNRELLKEKQLTIPQGNPVLFWAVEQHSTVEVPPQEAAPDKDLSGYGLPNLISLISARLRPFAKTRKTQNISRKTGLVLGLEYKMTAAGSFGKVLNSKLKTSKSLLLGKTFLILAGSAEVSRKKRRHQLRHRYSNFE